MEVYNLILSPSGKDLEKIPTNEVFMREGDRSSTRCVPSWHTCKCFKTSLGGEVTSAPLAGGTHHRGLPWHGHAAHVGALAWASPTHWCLGVGKPWASFGLGVGTLVPWCGQAARVGALAWARPTRWCLGVASSGHVLPLALALDVLILASAC